MSTNIDPNFEYVALAVDDVTGLPVPLKVDPVTGYLLIKIISGTSADLDVSSAIDSNNEGVALVYDDTALKIKPLKVEPNLGGVLVKF